MSEVWRNQCLSTETGVVKASNLDKIVVVRAFDAHAVDDALIAFNAHVIYVVDVGATKVAYAWCPSRGLSWGPRWPTMH